MTKPTRYNLVLPQQSQQRMDRLKELAEWQNNTEVVRQSLRLTEAMVEEFAAGSVFYIRRKGDEEPVPFQPFML